MLRHEVIEVDVLARIENARLGGLAIEQNDGGRLALVGHGHESAESGLHLSIDADVGHARQVGIRAEVRVRVANMHRVAALDRVAAVDALATSATRRLELRILGGGLGAPERNVQVGVARGDGEGDGDGVGAFVHPEFVVLVRLGGNALGRERYVGLQGDRARVDGHRDGVGGRLPAATDDAQQVLLVGHLLRIIGFNFQRL
mmetsp:Transcript_12131/g.27685  ORF Transcript_12131/g.27685 Transcript_12131/m.27685 type:complete len:202 (+) Transcript_12131:1246-1851(+)